MIEILEFAIQFVLATISLCILYIAICGVIEYLREYIRNEKAWRKDDD